MSRMEVLSINRGSVRMPQTRRGSMGPEDSYVRALEEKISSLTAKTLHDPLTGLLNRRGLVERLAEELERAGRYGREFSLAILDIDHFKQINDTLGHLKGDEVLSKLGELLNTNLRTPDVVARYGGEEFVIILTETSDQNAVKAMNRIREKIAGYNFGIGKKITVSIGIASYYRPPRKKMSEAARIKFLQEVGKETLEKLKENLLEQADQALYQAKEEGRNRVKLFEV